MPTRILVTGGAGYLGSILTPRLLELGYAVTVLDTLIYAQRSLFAHCAHPLFDFIRGDARDEAVMTSALATADVIIPLAAIVGMPACDRDPWATNTINLGAIQLLNRLRSRTQLVVYPNTNSGYGAQSGEVYCTEETPLEPISLYGRTKVAAEQELLASDNTIVFRLATVFGMSPRMRLDLLVNHFVYAAVTDGYLVLFEKDFKRNYVHIRDVADCFAYAIAHPERMVGRPFNVGLDNANLSKLELAELVRTYVPHFEIQSAELGSDPDKRNYIVSNARLRDAGFTASRTLEDGIRELIKGYRMFPRSPYANI